MPRRCLYTDIICQFGPRTNGRLHRNVTRQNSLKTLDILFSSNRLCPLFIIYRRVLVTHYFYPTLLQRNARGSFSTVRLWKHINVCVLRKSGLQKRYRVRSFFENRNFFSSFIVVDLSVRSAINTVSSIKFPHPLVLVFFFFNIHDVCKTSLFFISTRLRFKNQSSPTETYTSTVPVYYYFNK